MKLTPLELSRIEVGALPEIKVLNLARKDISHIDDISCCVDLRKIDLTGNRLHHTDSLSGLSYCSSLRWIKVEGNDLDSVDFVSRLGLLDVLNASRNKITIIPPSIAKCRHLKALILNHNSIRRLENIFSLTELNTLVISHNLIQTLPSMESLKALQKLSITHNRLHTLPKLDLPELKEVRLNDNKIASIPAGHLPPSLTVLDLGNNLLKTWEDTDALGQLAFLKNVNLKGNDIASKENYKDKMSSWFKDLRVLDGTRVDQAFLARKEKRKKIAELVETKTTNKEDAGEKGKGKGNEVDVTLPWNRPYGGTRKSDKYHVQRRAREAQNPDEGKLSKRNPKNLSGKRKPRDEEREEEEREGEGKVEQKRPRAFPTRESHTE